MKTYQVYAIGTALLDTEYDVSDKFLLQHQIAKGQTTRLEATHLEALNQWLNRHCSPKVCCCGGSSANSVIVLQSFGGKAFYTGAVGDDTAGKQFINSLSQAGVAYNPEIIHKEGITGQCVVMLTPDAERTMNVGLGVAANVTFDRLDKKALADCDYFFIESYLASNPEAVKAAIKARRITEAAGGKTAVTFSDPLMVIQYKNALVEILGKGVDLLFCNEVEACEWTKTKCLQDGINELRQLAKTLVVTLGADGALIVDNNREIRITPHRVKAINSNGAGDNFSGAFLYGVTQGMSFEKAGELASLTSASVVAQYGPRLCNEQYQAIRRMC
jgi:sugar/nucleoside kinase (ribokinase family)